MMPTEDQDLWVVWTWEPGDKSRRLASHSASLPGGETPSAAELYTTLEIAKFHEKSHANEATGKVASLDKISLARFRTELRRTGFTRVCVEGVIHLREEFLPDETA